MSVSVPLKFEAESLYQLILRYGEGDKELAREYQEAIEKYPVIGGIFHRCISEGVNFAESWSLLSDMGKPMEDKSISVETSKGRFLMPGPAIDLSLIDEIDAGEMADDEGDESEEEDISFSVLPTTSALRLDSQEDTHDTDEEGFEDPVFVYDPYPFADFDEEVSHYDVMPAWAFVPPLVYVVEESDSDSSYSFDSLRATGSISERSFHYDSLTEFSTGDDRWPVDSEDSRFPSSTELSESVSSTFSMGSDS